MNAYLNRTELTTDKVGTIGRLPNTGLYLLEPMSDNMKIGRLNALTLINGRVANNLHTALHQRLL